MHPLIQLMARKIMPFINFYFGKTFPQKKGKVQPFQKKGDVMVNIHTGDFLYRTPRSKVK